MKGFLLSIFVFTAFLATVYGLKCYVCIGTDESCSKEMLKDDTSKEFTCPSGYDKCSRTWAKNNDITGVVQSCAYQSKCDELKKACDDATSGDCAVGCCDTDLCNAGSPVSFSVFLMTVCSALGLALLK